MQQDSNMLLRSMYDEYQGTLRTLARCYKIPLSDIDDVIQETFIAYFNNYSLNWMPALKKSMLTRILKRKCIDYLRREKRRENNVSIEDKDQFSEADEAELLVKYMMDDVLDCLVRDEKYEELRNEIMNLKPDWREMAILYFVEERSIEEICDRLMIPRTACRSRIYRIRKYLRGALGSKYGF